jgi:dTDP-4-amino-4,6-dideoxygalactose transaminase
MMPSRFNSIPRFALPYTVADFAAGFHAIFRGGPSPGAFELFDDRPKFWTRSGRQALRLLLEAFDLKPGSGVALPLFTDPSLVKAIVAAGHKPVFIDVDPRFLTIDPECLERARGTFSAVVAVHLFGQPAEMQAILAASDGVPVIEDTAHAPFSYLNGRIAGTFGIACFYSFASTKYWPAGGGGLAVINDANVADRFARLMQSLSPPTRVEELRNLLLQGAKAIVFNRQFYGTFGKPMRRWADNWALLEPCLDLNAIQRSWAAVACRQASVFAQRVERQRANSLQLLSMLGPVEDVVLPHERPGAQYNYHLFPVLLRNSKERSELIARMWEAFVDTSTIYNHVVKEARRCGYEAGCPVAESVANRLITLPNYASLSSEDIGMVAKVFVSSLEACRDTGHDPAWRIELARTG